jgi:hypothetical protein
MNTFATDNEMKAFANTILQHNDIDNVCHKQLVILVSVHDEKIWLQESGNEITTRNYHNIATHSGIKQFLREGNYVDAVHLIAQAIIEESTNEIDKIHQENETPNDFEDYQDEQIIAEYLRQKPEKQQRANRKILLVCSSILVIILMVVVILCFCCKTLRNRICPCCKSVSFHILKLFLHTIKTIFQWPSYKRDLTPMSMYPKRKNRPAGNNIFVIRNLSLGAPPSYEAAIGIEKHAIKK